MSMNPVKDGKRENGDLISELPCEILEEILKRLTLHDLFNSQLVCKHWNEAVLSSGIWRDYYRLFTQDSCKDKLLTTQEYRRQFKKMYERIKHPEQHLRKIKVRTGQRKVKDFDFHEGNLVVCTTEKSKHESEYL